MTTYTLLNFTFLTSTLDSLCINWTSWLTVMKHQHNRKTQYFKTKNSNSFRRRISEDISKQSPDLRPRSQVRANRKKVPPHFASEGQIPLVKYQALSFSGEPRGWKNSSRRPDSSSTSQKVSWTGGLFYIFSTSCFFFPEEREKSILTAFRDSNRQQAWWWL